MIVVDASAIAEILFMTPAADAIMDRIYTDDEPLVAPHVIDLEIAHVVRRRLLAREIDYDLAEGMIGAFQQIPINRFPHDALLGRIWTLRNNITAYDAAYVALAEVLEAPLVTRDRRLSQSRGHIARIEYVE
jgi:predicted nucleic acid-binding protein